MAESRKPTRRAAARPAQRPASRPVAQPSRSRGVGAARGQSLGRSQGARKLTPPARSQKPTSVPQKGATHPVERRSGADRGKKGAPVRKFIIAGIVAAALALVSFVGVLVLSYTPAFTIDAIEAPETEHLTSDEIANLANVEEGTTLLAFDSDAITANLKKNPWVGSVSFQRVFPSTLKIVVTERSVDTVAVISNSKIGWAMSADGVWIEPVPLTVNDGESLYDVALAKAQELNALLVCDLPASVSPTAGSAATDEVISAVSSYRQQFSSDFSSQVVSYSAPSLEGITCMLSNGVEVALGSPTDVESKEEVVTAILSEREGKITYINVRVYTKPSYRLIDSDSVGQGSGAVASSTGSSADADDASDATDTSSEGSDSEGSEGQTSPEG